MYRKLTLIGCQNRDMKLDVVGLLETDLNVSFCTAVLIQDLWIAPACRIREQGPVSYHVPQNDVFIVFDVYRSTRVAIEELGYVSTGGSRHLPFKINSWFLSVRRYWTGTKPTYLGCRFAFKGHIESAAPFSPRLTSPAVSHNTFNTSFVTFASRRASTGHIGDT